MADTNIIFESRKNLLAILIKVAKGLTSERNPHRLMEKVLDEMRAVTNADGGTLYLMKGEGRSRVLEFAIVHNKTLHIKMGGTSGVEIPFDGIPLFQNGQENLNNVASYTALSKVISNIPDAYEEEGFDFSGAKKFDARENYRTKSIIAVPLINHEDEVIGVIQLINAREGFQVVPFNEDVQPIVEAIASYAAIALENQILMEEQRDLLISLSAEPNTACLIERILKEAQDLTFADGGTLYLLKEDDKGARLEFAIMKNKSLNISKGGVSEEGIELPPLPLYDERGAPNYKNIASYTALTKTMVNVDDAYHYKNFDFTGVKRFDEANGYSSKSFLTVPLLNHNKDVIGVIQLVNAKDMSTGQTVPFSKSIESIVEALAAYGAIALENDILVQDLKNLLDAFIKCIAKAIDAKSPHTSGHCQRVPALTELIAKAACDDTEDFHSFQLDSDGWYELHVASWMHDCGKLSTPDILLDKSTKLHLFRDGIEEVKLRVEVMKKNLRLSYYEKMMENLSDKPELEKELEEKESELDEIRDFLVRSNTGGEFMSEESQNRIKELAAMKWVDPYGQEKPLLTPFEVENMCIARGTLTGKERETINNHMVVTIDMLESLPFPKKLRNVPEYAGGHHEKMDGSGFPRGLKREEMSIPARMMAVADIFEALTSKDRPYKKPMPISVALNILKKMKQDNHIDPDLYDLFVRHRVWEKYAKEFLSEEQLDVDDVSAFLS